MSIGLSRDIARRHATRPALMGAQPVSYGELEGRVEALADGLLQLPTAAGDRVAIWMDKQPRYAEAILAALRAHCAYVPLDGRQPPRRIAHILADAQPAVLFTDARRLATLAAGDLPPTLRAVVLSDDGPHQAGGHLPCLPWGVFGRGTGSGAWPVPAAGDLAAILYTSGSTGLPKGVQITHRNLATFIGWAREELDFGPADVFANHASFNFDLSTFDLFAALGVGAAVWIVPDGQARDVAALADGIRRHGVTVWYSVPSILHLLSASGGLGPEVTGGLRYVLFAGEVFPMPQLRALARRLPERTALYNLYGPTETNVCTYHRVTAQDLAIDAPLPIGKPITGARAIVVDDEGRPAGDHDGTGELIIEGDCVTPGYWRRERESSAAGHHEGRHATGDLVSYCDGQLVYRGRKDRMVKLSGYRVELGEIEAAALRHPDIEEAAAVLGEHAGRPRLDLYLSVRPGARPPSLVEIKRHCAAHLPAYMLPQAVSCLDRLPRNSNGKVDYRLLQAGASSGARPALEDASR
jgi:L-proline---[L-prolyl-carrier protein] ligase